MAQVVAAVIIVEESSESAVGYGALNTTTHETDFSSNETDTDTLVLDIVQDHILVRLMNDLRCGHLKILEACLSLQGSFYACCPECQHNKAQTYLKVPYHKGTLLLVILPSWATNYIPKIR